STPEKETPNAKPSSVKKATAKKATAKKATASAKPLSAKKATASAKPPSGKKATASTKPPSGKKATASAKPPSGKKATASAKPPSGKKATASAKPPSGKKAADITGRKGSVDRIGKDVASPRAEAVSAFWKSGDATLKALDGEADYLGKKILARSIWALCLADESGEKDGMTTADISSLLSKVANLEVYPTNIGRACRDHSTFIEPTTPDGRSKRFALTATGKKAATELFH
ncbi:MAG: hypothetical protein GY822_00405, partial [Deltaproteobacteria bacterium]|nr:hypothetical protein [Deltaproteobacteria bacterium]